MTVQRHHYQPLRSIRVLAVLASLCVVVTAGCADTRSKYFGEPVQ
ncbi:hypothetical protein [Actinobaculum sp. 352]|nr:hypothetical protein [Actinobaculum sp. 352]